MALSTPVIGKSGSTREASDFQGSVLTLKSILEIDNSADNSAENSVENDIATLMRLLKNPELAGVLKNLVNTV